MERPAASRSSSTAAASTLIRSKKRGKRSFQAKLCSTSIAEGCGGGSSGAPKVAGACLASHAKAG
ncbi:MAG TPA: hypothetical protein PLY45_04150 [bacterium]|nr:hypothetical protein [bacterium]